MMKWFLVLVVALVLGSCGTTVYQLHTTCEKGNEELFQSLTTVLLSSNFMVKQNDPKNGYLQAETMPEFNFWLGMQEQRIWTFQLMDSIPKSSAGNDGAKVLKKLISSAKVVYVKQNVFGSTTGGNTVYYNDETHKDWTWYWDIRNRIQQLCSDIRIIEKKVN